MPEYNKAINQYIEDHSSPQEDLLNRLYRETYLKAIHPRMISGPLQGKLLQLLSQLFKPECILEIGTFTGYSAICLAKGLIKGGTLITIDKNDELSPISEHYFKEAKLTETIKPMHGDALEIIPELNLKFDLVFIDGDKKEYPEYYKSVLPKIKRGGVLLADNVLWDGKVIKPLKPDDKETEGIITFNKLISEDSQVENIILPIRDGLSLIRKL